MARPERNNVDYFPYLVDEGEKMYYIDQQYGNDGFATFIKILTSLAKTDYHYLDLSKRTTQMFLSAKCKVSTEILLSIITDLAELGKFDLMLWNENKIIWCQDFIDSIQDAYKKRNNDCICFDGLLILLDSLGVRKLNNLHSTGSVKPQSKVEYSKVEEIIEEQTIKNDFVDEELKAKKNELTLLLCEKFGWSEMRYSNKQRHVSAFVFVKILNDSDYDNFVIQFRAYDEYKTLADEKRHAPEKLIGTQSEQFNDSVLLSENWEARLINFKQQKPKTKFDRVADNQHSDNPYLKK